MAVVASVSSPTNGTVAINALLTALLGNGYLLKQWSDGLSTNTGGLTNGLSTNNLNTTSNPYGGSGSGAGNLGNSGAWFRIAAIDGSREFAFQRALDTTWTISRSKGGFNAGVNSTTLPTATDSQLIVSNDVMWQATPGRLFISVENTAPYGFTMFAIPLGGGNTRTFIADEPLLSGTIDPTDADPYVSISYYNATGAAPSGVVPFNVSQDNGALSQPRGWKRYPSNTYVLVNYGYVSYGSTSGDLVVAPPSNTGTQMGLTPTGAKEVPVRIQVFRALATATSTGWAGLTARHRWATVGGRANGQTLQAGTDYWIHSAGIWVPWDSSTPSLS